MPIAINLNRDYLMQRKVSHMLDDRDLIAQHFVGETTPAPELYLDKTSAAMESARNRIGEYRKMAESSKDPHEIAVNTAKRITLRNALKALESAHEELSILNASGNGNPNRLREKTIDLVHRHLVLMPLLGHKEAVYLRNAIKKVSPSRAGTGKKA